MKKRLFFLSLIWTTTVFSQFTQIPDSNFELALIDLGHDDVMDGQVLTSNINEITTLFVIQKGISDLTGIEDFTSLMLLNCAHNNLDAIDISQNQDLSEFLCNSNQISSLDLSTNPALLQLNCSSNPIGVLDLSENHVLKNLNCSNAVLHCLNIKNGNNLNMEYLIVTNNEGLSCIELDEVPYSGNGMSVDPLVSFSTNCDNFCSSSSIGINELNSPKHLFQILDMIGRETSYKPNTPLIYVYDDGSTEKVFSLEY